MKYFHTLLVLTLLLGCASDTSEPTGEMAERSETLALAPPHHHLDSLAREPMLAASGGRLYVSGYGSQVTGTDPESVPLLWTSDDGGGSWSRVDVGTSADGAAGNSDVDLVTAPNGTVYFLTMGFDRSVGEGTHIAVGVSRDEGTSWEWTRLSQDRFDDRPWIDIGPDGTAHVIWNDGAGVSYVTSSDDGATWVEHDRIHDRGGSSHLDVGPDGQIAVRVTPLSASGNQFDEGLELIATSRDGVSWSKHPVPGTRQWDPTFSDPTLNPRWVEPVAWDQEGSLFLLWAEDANVLLARSNDDGATWSTWTIAEEEHVAYFPLFVARGAGELAATWFVGAGENLGIRLARIDVPADGEPETRVADLFQPDAWLEVEGESTLTPAGEYVPVLFLEDDRLAVVTPIQDAANDRWGFTYWESE